MAVHYEVCRRNDVRNVSGFPLVAGMTAGGESLSIAG